MKLAHKMSRELLLKEIMALEELEAQRPIQEKGQVQEPLDMLGPHCWGCILSACTTADLARCRAVCKDFRLWVDDPAFRRNAFVQYWRLSHLEGSPRSANFFLSAGLQQFVWQHQLQRSDSLSSVAVRHGVSTHAITVTNNLFSEHSLLSRTRVFIPVTEPAALEGMGASFVFDTNSGREFVLVRDADSEEGWPQQQSPASSAADIAKISSMVAKGLKVDEDTFRFYLDAANGDLKEALCSYEHDAKWEAAQEDQQRMEQAAAAGSSGRCCLPGRWWR